MGIFDEATEVDIDELPLTFGKYAGKTPSELVAEDPSYVVWMYDNVRPHPCSKKLHDVAIDALDEGDSDLVDLEDPWYAEMVRR